MNTYFEIVVIDTYTNHLSRISYNIQDYNSVKECKKVMFNKFKQLKNSKKYVTCWMVENNKRLFLKGTTVKNYIAIKYYEMIKNNL